MASRESDRGDIRNQELVEITTCCICTDFYTDPKALPCIHTFCMKCLQQTGLQTNKGPGDEMPCPICRRQFKIPPEGFHGLPKNFFIESLIQMANISDPPTSSEALCFACVGESKEEIGKKIPTADVYCVDCKIKLCAECGSEHKKFKLTKNHELIPITEHEADQNVLGRLTQNACERNDKRVPEVYCVDCKTVMCTISFFEDHKNHEGIHVKTLLDGFRNQIKNNSDAINECFSQAQMKNMELLKVKEEMQQRVKTLECDITKRKDEIKQFADDHTNSLLEDLYAQIQSKLKEIQLEKDDVDAYLSSLESYNTYCQIIMDKGTPSDIYLAVSDLPVKAAELQKQCQPIRERRIQSFNFSFTRSELEEFLEGGCGNMIGEIEEGDSKQNKRSRQSPMAEFRNKIDHLRKETEIEGKDTESLRLETEQLRIKLDKEVQANKALTEQLHKEKANYNAHLETTKQEFENNKITNNTLQASNDKLKKELDAEKLDNNSLQSNIDKLKQELDAEKLDNNSLQSNNDKLLQEVDRYKTTVKTMEINAENLSQELKTTTTDSLTKYRNEPELVKKIDVGRRVWGLALLNDELFVVPLDSSAIFVYNPVTFKRLRTIQMEGLAGPRDIASCPQKNCLFLVIGASGSSLFCIDRKGKKLKKWQVPYEPHNLSVTPSGNILLTCNAKILIYDPLGDLMQIISLDACALDMSWHTIMLKCGNIIVCQGWKGSKYHRVLKLNHEGVILKSFGREKKHSDSHLSDPVYMAMDRDELICVADSGNNRVVLLNRELVFVKELLGKNSGITQPKRVMLDEASGLLYVVANYGQLLIFKVLK